MIKRLLHPVILFILAVALFAVIGVWQLSSEQNETSVVKLPETNKQAEIEESTYLYASNQALRDLLGGFDMNLKAQNLKPDMSSEAFEYSGGSGKTQKIEDCVEFRYFKDKELAVTVTLVPADPACFSENKTVLTKLGDLHVRFQYVYVISKHLTD